MYIAARLAAKKGNAQKANELYEKAIEACEKNDKFEAGAGLAQESGHTEKAIQLYERAGRFDVAYKLANEKGDTKKASELYEKGLQHYEKLGWFSIAAELTEAKGDAAKANEFYDRQSEAYFKDGRFSDAGFLAEKAGRIDRAIELHSQEKKYNRGYAAGLALKHGKTAQAMQLYEGIGDFDKVAELAEQLGEQNKARVYKTLVSLLKNDRLDRML